MSNIQPCAVILPLLKIKTVTFYLQPRTYPNERPVAEVVDGAEEPELVEEQVGSRHSAFV